MIFFLFIALVVFLFPIFFMFAMGKKAVDEIKDPGAAEAKGPAGHAPGADSAGDTGSGGAERGPGRPGSL